MRTERLKPLALVERNASGRTIFLSDEYEVLEAPTQWIGEVAMRRSRSSETEGMYSRVMAGFLQWLDDVGYGCAQWNAVDSEIFDRYIEFLRNPPVFSKHSPSAKTIAYYACRIADFYDWARKKGYKHYFDLSMKEVEISLKNQLLLGHVSSTRKVSVPDIRVERSISELIKHERQKFVTQENHKAALALMDDVVFVVIATIFRITALRPKELLQLPYKGGASNPGFIPYDTSDIPVDLSTSVIDFICESKGKRRLVRFPGKLWEAICKIYMPIRRIRSRKYRARVGVSPPNSALFLTKDGYIVDYRILYYHFSKIGRKVKECQIFSEKIVYSQEVYGARMLRHTCATYFVIDSLRLKNMLGKPYFYDAGIDEDLRQLLGHSDVETTYKYYVHLINRMHGEDLLQELHQTRVDGGLSLMLDRLGFS